MERKGDRETEKQRDRETERQRDRETERQIDREIGRKGGRERLRCEVVLFQGLGFDVERVRHI
jgi:hypothetical protein